MSAERISPVIPVDDMGEAVRQWATVLGVEPTFVDADRWAQFDVGGSRLALAGTDRASDQVGVMVKLDDLDAGLQGYRAAGFEVGEIIEGPHELRCEVLGLASPLTIYTSR